MDNVATSKRAQAWLSQARHDLEAARANAEEGRYALACFLSHQSAEKAVAGFLYSRGAEQVWGHALADLCEDAQAFDQSFDLVKSIAVLLDKHFLGARYPESIVGGVPAEAYEQIDSERAVEIAGDVFEAVRQRLDE
jgi:HEPN domain-containing protein